MNDFINYGFIILTILGALFLISKKKPSSLIQAYSSTLGVLGTFVGVYIGLINFDENNLSDSVPELLGGLKTAFSTSIVGMVVALLTKLFYKGGNSALDSNVIRHNDVLNALNDIIIEIKKLNINGSSSQRDVLDSLASMNTQMKDGINIINGSINKMNESLHKFGEEVAKQSSEELIKSIQRVMDDFDAKINDQLGEQFHVLAQSTDNLNKWQQEHIVLLNNLNVYSQQHIDEMKKFADLMKLLEELNRQIRIMAEFINILHGSGENLKVVVPNIQNTVDGISRNLNYLSDNLNKTISFVCGSVMKSSQSINEAENEIRKSVEIYQKEVTSTMNEIAKYSCGILQKFYNDIKGNNRNMLF